VITGFRDNDIAAGGQGAPLAPVAEYYLFHGCDFYLNLGGIANLSYFNSEGHIRAWDIAPANQLLNFLSAELQLPYDDKGALARSGSVDVSLLKALNSLISLPVDHAFSLDNGWIETHFLPVLKTSEIRIPDKLATVTEFIAESVRTQIANCTPVSHGITLLVTGGGAHNVFLIETIRRKISPVSVEVPDTDIIDFKEAILMALCGVLRIIERPNAFASVTGATHDTINGMITIPATRN
jgi:anhydro-N-acetylmuramic acid kinase